jgi:hypothetical protein
MLFYSIQPFASIFRNVQRNPAVFENCARCFFAPPAHSESVKDFRVTHFLPFFVIFSEKCSKYVYVPHFFSSYLKSRIDSWAVRTQRRSSVSFTF